MSALARIVAVLLAALGALTVTAPAHALSCALPNEVIEDADHVFVGRVVDSLDGRLLVEVDEVWTGGPVPKRVWLVVGLLEWSGLTDDEGELRDGLSFEHRSVFADTGSIDSTGPCTMWSADDPMVMDHRPANVSAPARGAVGVGAALSAAGGAWNPRRGPGASLDS